MLGVEQVCTAVFISKNVMEYSFPLGRNGLATGLLANKFLFMNFVLQYEAAVTRKRSFQYINTKTAIRASNLRSTCRNTPSILTVDFADQLHFQMLDGMLNRTSQLDSQQIAYFPDILDQEAMAHIHNDPALPYTFIVQADAMLAHDRIHVEIPTIFTMYFLSSAKKTAMLNLLDSTHGFATLADGSVEPSEDVLRICPLHVIPGVFGCVSRFEVQHGIHELADTSILEISADELLCPLLAKSWAQQQRTTSDFYAQTITQHAETVRSVFKLDHKRHRGFLISQDLPWRKHDLDNANIDLSDHVQYAQVCFVSCVGCGLVLYLISM